MKLNLPLKPIMLSSTEMFIDGVYTVVLWAASISHLGVVVEVKVFRQHLEATARHDVAEGIAAEWPLGTPVTPI